ncbi:MAG TPA: LuxR C-terminal-related transcriptional regulator [Candidatus Baltobacteraceae bacterium]|nr:LuxR C-terminal-related transcriptional regulator [Candidatus Baltobacteraceae bacterium]
MYAQAGAHELEAGCRVTAAITAYGTGLPDSTAPLRAMLDRLDPEDYLARARVQLGLAWLWATFAFPFRAATYLESIDARALGRPDLALRYHNISAFNAMTIGDLDAFRREYAAWLEAARASGAPQSVAGAYTNGAMAFAFFGLHEEAQQAIEDAHTAARAARSRHAEESVYAFDVLCCVLRGDLTAARAALERVSPASENRVNITFATAFGTMIGAATGDRDLIATWFDGFEEDVLAKPEVEHGAGFAEILVRRGRYTDAQDLLHRCLPDCELVRGNVPTLLAIGLYGRPEDRARARAYLQRAAQGPAPTPERAALALFDAREHRRNGRVAEARELGRAAAEGFHSLRYPLFEAAALETAGDMQSAIALYRKCGATHDARRLTEPIPAAPAPMDALSLREQQIATLASQGRSNLQIAGDLSITHKTVEKHLASAYRKLGVKSRTLLSAVLSGSRKQ